MSGTSDDDAPLDLAAEYVLGTLDADDATAAARRAASDSPFAAEIRFWEAKLAPLAELAPAVAPPASLWTRIEQSTQADSLPRAANDNALAWWRASALTCLAVAAGLAAFIALRPPTPAPSYALPIYAVLAPIGSTQPLLVAVVGQKGSLLVRATASIQVAADRDLELWSLPPGATKPAPLGVLPAAGLTVPPGQPIGTKLLVSLEPKGGSPTGQPTGAVLYGGVLAELD